jgi:hypothetical protein
MLLALFLSHNFTIYSILLNIELIIIQIAKQDGIKGVFQKQGLTKGVLMDICHSDVKA